MLHSNTPSKVIYKTSSTIQTILLVIFRLLYISIATTALYHYNENPIVTIIIAFICTVFFVVTGQGQTVVYSDSFKYSADTLIKLFRRNKHFNISDLKSFEVNGDFNTADELNTKPISGQTKPLNKILITFRDGTTAAFETSIYKKKLDRVSEEIANLIINKK